MTTDPGDLVLDPTCGSGTTAYVAEKWGRRWITIDTSRVPLALTRQRLSTATFPYFELKDEARGPAGGFVYVRKQNRKGEEIGGIVPHLTLKSIANNEPVEEELLVDQPEEVKTIVRVTGPLCVEATIPTPLDLDGDGYPDDGSTTDERVSFVDRMLDTLRRAPILQGGGGRTVTLKSVRQPAKTLALSAEALVDATAEGQKATLSDAVIETDEKNKLALPLSQRPVAIVFGPENGSVSERLVYEAATEAAAKKYTHLYVIGFAIQPNAETLVAQSDEAIGVPATWVPVTPDVVMGDLLRTTRASQIFSLAGRPDIEMKKVPPEKKGDPLRWQVTLVGLDTFDPVTMEVDKLQGNDVPCWMLDSDYGGRVFHASQVFFPRTEAWDSLKKALRTSHEESVWDHLAALWPGAPIASAVLHPLLTVGGIVTAKFWRWDYDDAAAWRHVAEHNLALTSGGAQVAASWTGIALQGGLGFGATRRYLH
jgi:adenine-specific DNA-methyltransferase